MPKSKLTKVGGIALATFGLSTCNNNGAVDPAPPPLTCPDVARGEPLSAQGSLSGSDLTVEIAVLDLAGGAWTAAPSISDPVGVTVKSAVLVPGDPGMARVALVLDAPNRVTGTFTVRGSIRDYSGTSCPLTRTFTFNIKAGAVTVARADRPLPLHSRDRVTIAMAERQGRTVALRADGATAGAALSWTATEGAVEQTDHGVRWTLPDAPGLYQIELLADRGADGATLDTLTLEVS